MDRPTEERILTHWTLGIIGGSGLYEFEGLMDRRWVKVDSPWGEPSDELLFGVVEETVWFFCRGMGGVTDFRPAP